MEDSTEVEEAIPDEGPVPVPSTEMMTDASFWCHHPYSVLRCGRTALMDAEQVEGDERDPEEIKKELEKADPSEPRLKPITGDASVQGGFTAW